MGFDVKSLGDLYPWEPKQLTLADGQTLSYVDEGPEEAELGPLLCVHGNPTWSFYFREVVRAFAPTRRVIAVDHIGCGLSSKPQDYAYTLQTHVDNLTALVEHLGLDRVTLVVHDWGGAIGCGWATAHPERVERLVVMNTAAFRSKRIPFSINLCRVPGLGAVMVRGFNGFARAAVIRAAHTKLSSEVARGYTGPYDSWANRIATLRFVQDIPMHSGIPSYAPLVGIEEGLERLRHKPMLICWGGGDFCFDDSFLEEWQRRFPEAEVHRFAAAGHYVLEDAREQVLERMRAFLAQQEPAGATS